MIDLTLACEDAYSKLVEIVTVPYVSDEDRVGNTLLQIWKLRLCERPLLRLYFIIFQPSVVLPSSTAKKKISPMAEIAIGFSQNTNSTLPQIQYDILSSK